MTNYYGFPPGYDPNPHHPRQAPPTLAPIPPNRLNRAGLDGGQWISADGDWIYHQRFGDYWEAHWTGDGFGAWGPTQELPEGVVKL